MSHLLRVSLHHDRQEYIEALNTALHGAIGLQYSPRCVSGIFSQTTIFIPRLFVIGMPITKSCSLLGTFSVMLVYSLSAVIDNLQRRCLHSRNLLLAITV